MHSNFGKKVVLYIPRVGNKVYNIYLEYKYTPASCEIEDFVETHLCKLRVIHTPIARNAGCVFIQHTACKDEVRQNIQSHSWCVFQLL